MTVTFRKIGTTTNWFHGIYETEYVFTTLSNLPIATIKQEDSTTVIKFNETTFKITSVPGGFTEKYAIHDGDSTVGHIKLGPRAGRYTIELLNGTVFRLERVYKSIWERLNFIERTCRIELRGNSTKVYYEFVKEARIGHGYHCELAGNFVTDANNLEISLFGIFLIERMLAIEYER